MADNKDFISEEDQTIKHTEFFCKVLSELNDVSLRHIEGLLNITIKAAEATNLFALSNHSSGENTKFEELVGYLNTKAEDFNSKANSQSNEISQNEKTAQTTAFSDIDRNIIIAIANSLSTQQQLNITGIAILTQAAELLFTVAAQKKDRNNKTDTLV